VFLSDAEHKTEAVDGWVTDRSTGGLAVVVGQPVEPGTILSIRTANAPDTVSWYQVEVRSCRPVEADWELGCQWVKAPPWSVLLLFG
jgi:hypothetical protein